MKLGKDEREELIHLAGSSSLREDMIRVTANRYNPIMVSGRVDTDKLLIFLTEYNEFINHKPKPFKPMSDRNMRL